MSEQKKVIVSIVSAAPGWFATYCDVDKDQPTRPVPVACWAVVQDADGRRSIVGYGESGEGFIDDLEGDQNHVGYSFHPNGHERDS